MLWTIMPKIGLWMLVLGFALMYAPDPAWPPALAKWLIAAGVAFFVTSLVVGGSKARKSRPPSDNDSDE